jgi:hypothetical protein
MNVVFDLAAALLLFAVARRRLPSWWAIGFLGAIVLLAPSSDYITTRLSEPLATLLLVASLWLLVQAPSPRRWLALGLCLGALLLCRPAFALLPVAIALWAVTLGRAGLGGRSGWIVAALFAGVVGLWAPWVVRNAVLVDRFIPLTVAGSGVSLWLSTWYDGGRYWSRKRDPSRGIVRTIPARAFSSPEEQKRVVPQFDRYIELYFSNGGVKLAEPDRALREIALEKIRANPVDWVVLRARGTAKMLKQQYFGARLAKKGYFGARLAKSKIPWGIVAWFVGVLAVVGAVMSVWRPSWQPVSLIFLYTWLIHFPTHGEPRYLTPAYGAVMLLATLVLYEAATWLASLKGGGAIRSSSTRIAPM